MALDADVYNYTKSMIVARCGNSASADLIERFRSEINSPRRLDSIRNLEELIHILEKRNCVNTQDVSRLVEITRYSNQHDLAEWIQNQTLNENIPIINPLTPGQQHNINNHRFQNQPPVQNNNPPSVRQPVRDRIYNYIIENIGYKWKEFARCLGIKEGKIDELEEQYRYDPSERVRQILRQIEGLELRSWLPLLEALGNSRRHDMRLYISQHILN